MEVENMEKMKPVSEEKARLEVGRIEKKYGVKYPKREKEKAIKRLMGKAPWFD